MGLSAGEIEAVVAEAAPALRAGRLERIHHPLEDRVLLVFSVPEPEAPPVERRLLLCFHRRHARLHLAAAAPPNPPHPSAFCMALRHHLRGARLEALLAVPGERAAALLLRARDEAGEERRLRLAAEFFGRGGNLVLVDEASGLALAVLRPQPAGARPLLSGLPYRPAPPPAAPPERTAVARAAHTAAPATEEPFPLNREIEVRLGAEEAALSFEERKASARREARRRLEAAKRKAANLQEDLARIERPKRFLEQGELLKASLARLGGADARGLAEVVVTDYFSPDAPDVVLALEPSLTLRENMERLFKRHRKAVSGLERIRRHLDHTEAELRAARGRLEAVEAASSLEDLEALAPAPPRRGAPSRARAPLEARAEPGVRRFLSRDTLEILVGKGDEENDRLTFRIANGNDLWLHVRDFPGSHVIVRLPRGRPVPQETLLDAAHLAAFFSSCRDRPVVEVAYTARKNVHKPRGARPGLVTLAAHRSLRLRVEPERLDRLLGRDRLVD